MEINDNRWIRKTWILTTINENRWKIDWKLNKENVEKTMKIVRKYYKINESDQDTQKSMKTAVGWPAPKSWGFGYAPGYAPADARTPFRSWKIVRWQIKQIDQKRWLPVKNQWKSFGDCNKIDWKQW